MLEPIDVGDSATVRHTPVRDVALTEPARWRARYMVQHYRVRRGQSEAAAREMIARDELTPYEVIVGEGNKLMTIGATELWSALSGTGSPSVWSTTNTMLAVGDSTTAPTITDTDLGAAPGATANVGDITAATNASPIVLTVGSWNGGLQPTVGQVVVVTGVNGNTAANGTYEVGASTITTVSLLNSTGNGAFATSAGSTVKSINKYRQQANTSGSAVVSTNQIVYIATFGQANANFHWQEWGTAYWAAGTANRQGVPPTKLLNHAVADLGTKTNAAISTLTVTLSLA